MDKETEDNLSRLEQRCKRTAAAHFSLLGANNCFNQYLSLFEEGNDILLNSLLVTPVVNYCRPFSSNKSKDGTKFTYPIRQLKSAEEYSPEIHGLLMDLRNKLIAHDDSSTLDTKLSYMGASVSKADVSGSAFMLVNTTAGMVYLIESIELCKTISRHLNALVGRMAEIQKEELTNLLSLLHVGENFSDLMKTKKGGVAEDIVIPSKEAFMVPRLSNHPVSELEIPKIDGYADSFRCITNSSEMGMTGGLPSELKIQVFVK